MISSEYFISSLVAKREREREKGERVLFFMIYEIRDSEFIIIFVSFDVLVLVLVKNFSSIIDEFFCSLF